MTPSIFESSLQPSEALIFFAGGGAISLAYEVYLVLRKGGRLPVLSHIADGLFAFAGAVLFLALSHFFEGGRLEYYFPVSFLLGGILTRAAIRRPLRKIFFKIRAAYKIQPASQTNGEEGRIMAQATKSKSGGGKKKTASIKKSDKQ
jgi:hypothetical protein